MGLPSLLNLLQLRDLYSIVSYIDSDTLRTLFTALPTGTPSKFLQVARITYFLHNYLTRTDRSLYMPFYAEHSYHKIENELLRMICAQSANVLTYFLTSYNHIFNRITHELTGF